MTRDACAPYIQYHTSSSGNSNGSSITAITVAAKGGRITGSQGGNLSFSFNAKYVNTCPVKIPVALPKGTKFTALVDSSNNGTTASIDQELNGGSYHIEQLGNDPPVLWVQINGQPATFNLTDGITM